MNINESPILMEDLKDIIEFFWEVSDSIGITSQLAASAWRLQKNIRYTTPWDSTRQRMAGEDHIAKWPIQQQSMAALEIARYRKMPGWRDTQTPKRLLGVEVDGTLIAANYKKGLGILRRMDGQLMLVHLDWLIAADAPVQPPVEQAPLSVGAQCLQLEAKRQKSNGQKTKTHKSSSTTKKPASKSKWADLFD